MENINAAAEQLNKPQRNAAMDALRIVAMAFIVILHLVQNNMGLSAVKGDASALSVNAFIPLSAVACVAVIGVNLFFLLSGYFGIKAKPSKVFSLIFKVYILRIVSTLLGMALGELKFSSFAEWFLFCGAAISGYWFIIVYILLCLAAPFLNAFAQKLAEGGGGTYFAVVSALLFSVAGFVADIFYPYFGTGEGFLPVWAWVVYIYGRMIKNGESSIKIKPAVSLLFWLLCTALNAAAMSVIFGAGGNGGLALHCFAYNNPLVIAGSVFFFLAFLKGGKTGNMRAAKLISAVAPHTLTVYLIHSNNPLVSPHRAFLIDLSPHIWAKFLLLLPNALLLYMLGIAADILYEKLLGKPIGKICRQAERGIIFLYRKIFKG